MPSLQGFTLLEAVVALAVFAAGAMALYGLFNTNLISLTRAQETMDQAPYVDYAIDYLSAVNPRMRPEGRVDLGGFDVTWTSALVEPVRQSQNGNGFMGNFEIGLYEVGFEVRVLERGGLGRATSLGVYRMRLVGFEKVRGLGTDFARIGDPAVGATLVVARVGGNEGVGFGKTGDHKGRPYEGGSEDVRFGGTGDHKGRPYGGRSEDVLYGGTGDHEGRRRDGGGGADVWVAGAGDHKGRPYGGGSEGVWVAGGGVGEIANAGG